MRHVSQATEHRVAERPHSTGDQMRSHPVRAVQGIEFQTLRMEQLHKFGHRKDQDIRTTPFSCKRGFVNGILLDWRSNIWINMNEILIPATAKGYSQSDLCPCTLFRSIWKDFCTNILCTQWRIIENHANKKDSSKSYMNKIFTG